VVLNVFSQSGLVHTNHPTRWNVLWTKRVTLQEWASANEYQKINHFPGTRGIARKDNLAKNINRLKRQHGDEHFSFLPNSYILPQEMGSFENDLKRNGGTWILKPAASSCGKGIRLVNSLPVNLGPKAKEYDGKEPKPGATWVMQRYIADPMLIDGYKFDLRLYVLVTGFDPLRIYMFNEGLVRFATERYVNDPGNLENQYMHLTNYSLNKHSTSYVSPAAAAKAAAAAQQAKAEKRQQADEDEDQEDEDDDANDEDVVSSASKWTLSSFKKYCQAKGIDWNNIQQQMNDIVIKTLISVEAEVLKEMWTKCQQSSCFELFGWDMMLDEKYNVHLIEVNIMPSLSCTTSLDKAVKYALVENTLCTAGATPFHRKRFGDVGENPNKRHPRYDQLTFETLPNLKAAIARISDTSKPFLECLTPEHKLMIMEYEDEYSRRHHYTRIFPTFKSWGKYGRFFEGLRPNNMVLARWEKEKKKRTFRLDGLSPSISTSPRVRTTSPRAAARKNSASKSATGKTVVTMSSQVLRTSSVSGGVRSSKAQ